MPRSTVTKSRSTGCLPYQSVDSGHVTFESFHPYEHYAEALVFQTSDSLDRMLGRTTYVPG